VSEAYDELKDFFEYWNEPLYVSIDSRPVVIMDFGKTRIYINRDNGVVWVEPLECAPLLLITKAKGVWWSIERNPNPTIPPPERFGVESAGGLQP
jgi:hypothetical protein